MLSIDPLLLETLGGLVGFLLTLLVFSYIFLGDNALFRVAVYIFVGVSAGYAASVVWHNILVPRLVTPLSGAIANREWGALLVYLIPLLLSFLLLSKLSPKLGKLGNSATAYLVGVGAAVAIGGAVLGTIFPQVAATTGVFNLPGKGALELLLDGSIFLIGTLTTLIYFHFGARLIPNQAPQRHRLIELAGRVGQFFIAVTFGVMFAGVYAAALTALIERVQFLWQFIIGLVGL
jgi:hypothetical protein